MKALRLLLMLLATFAIAGCNKDGNTDDDDDDDPNKPGYTQVAGEWEWIGKDYLHVPSDHGFVRQSFVVNGELYTFWNENLGMQGLAQLSYYDGSGWHNVFTDVNADGETNFTVHNNTLYGISSDIYSSEFFSFSGGVKTPLNSISWSSPGYSKYLGSTGSDLYAVAITNNYPVDTVQFTKWNGTEWLITDSSETITTGYAPVLQVLSGDGKIYLISKDNPNHSYTVYTYSGAGTLHQYAAFTRDYLSPHPYFFVHGGQLHMLDSKPEFQDGTLKQMVVLNDGGSRTIKMDQDSSGKPQHVEAYSTPQGIVYTTGRIISNVTMKLEELRMLKDDGTQLRYNITFDSLSEQESVNRTIGLLDDGIYDGSVFFFYNGALHTISNAHAGAFGTTGGAATKVYFARYNAE